MTYFLNQCHATKLTDSKSRMKVIKVNPKIKHKCKAVLGVTRNLILDLVFYFVMPYTAYMKHTIHHLIIFYGKPFTTVATYKNFSKLLQ